MVSKLGYVLFYTAFLSFVVYVSGQAGASILSGVPEFANVPEPSILDVLGTVSWFFALLSVSTEYQILFALVFTPLTVGMVWALVEIIRGV
jgi:hypothetical protein